MLPDRNTIQTIIDYKIPSTKKGITKIFRTNWLFKNLYRSICIAHRENNEFTWNDIHTKSVNNLKEVITNYPLLQNFDDKKPIVIQSDSSTTTLACVMLQDNKPICYASKSLTKTEINYGIIEEEFLGILAMY